MMENLKIVNWLAKPLTISIITAQILIGNAHVFAADEQKSAQQYEKSPKTVENVKLQILGINDFHGQLDTTSDYGNGPVGRADYVIKEYTVVVNNFMAAGGDNYKVLVEGTNRLVGRTDLEALYDYLVKTFKGGIISASIEGRITNLNVAP
jgi:2',3'-cyclic-nucleotide 2'-phosphodiesterase (5'-nucleotidase family)